MSKRDCLLGRTNAVKARLRRLEMQVQVLAPKTPGKAQDWQYPMVDRDEYEAAMALLNLRYSSDGLANRFESPVRTVPDATRDDKPTESQ
jgi:hypothetical protein